MSDLPIQSAPGFPPTAMTSTVHLLRSLTHNLKCRHQRRMRSRKLTLAMTLCLALLPLASRLDMEDWTQRNGGPVLKPLPSRRDPKCRQLSPPCRDASLPTLAQAATSLDLCATSLGDDAVVHTPPIGWRGCAHHTATKEYHISPYESVGRGFVGDVGDGDALGGRCYRGRSRSRTEHRTESAGRDLEETSGACFCRSSYLQVLICAL